MSSISSTRVFCEELETELVHEIHDSNDKELLNLLSTDIIGNGDWFNSPYGDKRITYADYTASGKSLNFIEDYIRKEVLPTYGNTHTTTSITGLQTTCYRHEARQIIAQAVNAKITGRGSEDCVLFVGSGTTSAVNKLVHAMGLKIPLSMDTPNDQRPVVFVGPFEHHSNLLPWRESSAEVVMIKETIDGKLDESYLKQMLETYSKRPLKIGAFSAVSNLTGCITDVDSVTCLLHQHGALAFWDYAAGAPYLNMDMNPVVADERRPYVYKDAIYFSGHKFIGGPNSPGVLIIKKRLLNEKLPTNPGGGTVFYVTENDHRYLSNKIEREEGGTPDIIGSIRLGLAMEVKQRIGIQTIHQLEKNHLTHALNTLQKNSKIILLGNQIRGLENSYSSLPILSFLISCGKYFLHYNFVCALLNDLFGIQSRGGCQCAGPYGQRLLGISKLKNHAIEAALINKKELLRPGFTRLSFPYFMKMEEINYILEAIDFIALHGWKFLIHYQFNHKTGEWKHTTRFTKFPNRKWLSRIDFISFSKESIKNSNQFKNISTSKSESKDISIQEHWKDNFKQAYDIIEKINVELHNSSHSTIDQSQIYEKEFEELRWFIFPSEIYHLKEKLSTHEEKNEWIGPIQPNFYIEMIQKCHLDDEKNEEKKKITLNTSSNSLNNESITKSNQIQSQIPNEKKRKQEMETTRQLNGKYPLRDGTMTCNSFEQSKKVAIDNTDKSIAAKLFPKPPNKLMKLVGQAIQQWNMIQDGDRLLLGLSGGKDSLTLLHVLLTLQKRAPIKFQLAAATVDPQTPSFDPSPLKNYLQTLNVEYYYLEEQIIERAKCEMSGDSLCSYCSRMKRGLLYACCRQHSFNKLVLAQHLDDLAESFIMSAIHNGQIRTMKANYWNDKKDIQVIRPLIYVRENIMKKFAYDVRLPIINENCPACFEQPKERQRIKKMLFQEESLFPDMYNSIRRALLPLMDNDIYQHMSNVRTRIDQVKRESIRSKPTKGTPLNRSQKTNGEKETLNSILKSENEKDEACRKRLRLDENISKE